MCPTTRRSSSESPMLYRPHDDHGSYRPDTVSPAFSSLLKTKTNKPKTTESKPPLSLLPHAALHRRRYFPKLCFFLFSSPHWHIPTRSSSARTCSSSSSQSSSRVFSPFPFGAPYTTCVFLAFLFIPSQFSWGCFSASSAFPDSPFNERPIRLASSAP